MKRLKCAKLVVKPSNIHGYGVFAGQPLAKGDLIEECATLRLDDAPIKALLLQGKHHLSNYIHQMNDDIYIPLGCGSLYNHSNKPNAKLVYNTRHDTMEIWALESIIRGQEIVMYYGNHWVQSNKNRIVKPSNNTSFAKIFFQLPLAKTFILVIILLIVLKIMTST